MLKLWALGKDQNLKELRRYISLRGSEVTLRKGWDLQMPISVELCPELNLNIKETLLLKLIPCKIPKEAEISDLPITPSVLCLSIAFNSWENQMVKKQNQLNAYD